MDYITYLTNNSLYTTISVYLYEPSRPVESKDVDGSLLKILPCRVRELEGKGG